MTLRIILLFVIIIGGAFSAFCQDCDHVSNSEARFENLGMKPLARVTSFDGVTIEYFTEDKQGVHLGKFTVNEKSKFPKNFAKNFKDGFYWLLFCKKDGYLYGVIKAED
jgi:hypothetical protein